MRRVMRFAAADVLPSESEVLHRLGMPRDAHPSPGVRALLAEASERFERVAEPRGTIQEVSADEFGEIYRGEGRNAAETPLELIYPRAAALALFVGTVGNELSEEIDRAFGDDDTPLALVIDAFASEGANRVAYLLAMEFAPGDRTLPYSPGYCGWHVSGQGALFAALQPDDIGVALKPSFLMTPVKSVSGVLVTGDASVHRFRPAYAFCDECQTHECIERMRSMRR
jgi:hypothetical protein